MVTSPCHRGMLIPGGKFGTFIVPDSGGVNGMDWNGIVGMGAFVAGAGAGATGAVWGTP